MMTPPSQQNIESGSLSCNISCNSAILMTYNDMLYLRGVTPYKHERTQRLTWWRGRDHQSHLYAPHVPNLGSREHRFQIQFLCTSSPDLSPLVRLYRAGVEVVSRDYGPSTRVDSCGRLPHSVTGVAIMSWSFLIRIGSLVWWPLG